MADGGGQLNRWSQSTPQSLLYFQHILEWLKGSSRGAVGGWGVDKPRSNMDFRVLEMGVVLLASELPKTGL